MFRKIALCVTMLGLSSPVWAEGFWNIKPWTQWTERECLRMLHDSPWVVKYYITGSDSFGAPATPATKVFPQSVPRALIRLRFETAVPVQEAYARLRALRTACTPAAAAQSILDYRDKWKGHIVLALQPDIEEDTNRLEWLLSFDRTLRMSTTEQWNRRAYVISRRLGRVTLEAYEPPAADGKGAMMIFPDTVHQQSVINLKDKQIAVEIDGTNFRWDLGKMIYKGELTY